MKNNRCIKVIAALLSLIIVSLPLAGTISAVTFQTENTSVSASAQAPTALPVSTIDALDIPAAVGIDTAQKKGIYKDCITKSRTLTQ